MWRNILIREFSPVVIVLLLFLSFPVGVFAQDTTPPTILSLDPADGATGVSLVPDMEIVFSEAIVKNSFAQIRRVSDDSVVKTLSAPNTNAIRVGTTNVTDDTITINWPVELDELTDYYIYLELGFVVDTSGNPFAGYTDNTSWNFTTGDFLGPQIVALTPPNNDPDATATTFSAQFDETVTTGSGNINLYSGTEVLALNEPFDDASQFAGENQFSSSGGGQFFGINFGTGDGSGIWGNYNGQPSANPTNFTTYTGFDGSYLDSADTGQMISTSDAQSNRDTPSVLVWDDISITGLNNLSFSGQFAAGASLEEGDYFRIEVDIDNTGSFTELVEYRGDGSGFLREELTGDNFGDGARLNTAATTLIFPISGTGSTLDLRFTILSTSGGDRMAMDSFIVAGISSRSLVEQVSITDEAVSINGDTLTYTPGASLQGATRHFVVVDAGAITDTTGNAENVLAAAAAWNFVYTDGDTTPPSLQTLSPDNHETEVAVDANLVMTFDENVTAGTGNVTIYNDSTDAVVETIAIGANNVTFNGQTVTINPSANLDDTTTYYVQVDNTAITDTSTGKNPFVGINDGVSWRFSTVDLTAPVVQTLSPANSGENVELTANLSITFDENVVAGTGNITIHKASTDAVVETIAIVANNVTFNGSTVTIDPVESLLFQTEYYIQIAPTSITDTAPANNAYVGITDTATWRFTTSATVTGDVTRDGFVTPADVVFVLNRLGQTATGDNAPADVNDDTLINQADADLVVSAIGNAVP